MKNLKLLITHFTVLAPAAFIAPAVFLAPPAQADALVVDPYRAADVAWPSHELKGRTWRYLLAPGSFDMDAVKNEAFSSDAGVAVIHAPSKLKGDRADRLFEFSEDPNEKRFVVSEPHIPASLLPRLKEQPFLFYEATRCVMGLKHEDCDLRVYDRFVKDYPETYLGTVFGEWNSRVIYFLPRKRSQHYLDFVKAFPQPWSRDQFYRNFLAYWDIAAGQKGPRCIGLSGPCNLTAIGTERGSTLACIEITGESRTSWRELMMFTASAGRQFAKPLCYYLAQFLGPVTADSRPGVCKSWGEDWGTPANLIYRTILNGYYRGANYQQFECFPWGFVKEVEIDDSCSARDQQTRSARVSRADKKKKTSILTGNGRAIKRAYDFIRSPEGARGDWYAPIAILVDRAHGHDGLSGKQSVHTGHGPFANEFPPTAADQFLTDLLQNISNDTRGSQPYEQGGKIPPIAEYQFGLFNSPLADIFDIVIANPITPGSELRADQLAKYPVVLCVGGIQWDEQLLEKISDYVEQGGTFVYPKGDPSYIKKSGLGNVFTIDRNPKKMLETLLAIQKEVLPCSYTGECETVWNVMPDGSWRVMIANNAGVEKLPKGSVETFHDEYAKTVTFDLPAGATARELMTGEVTSKILLPPGEVRVLEIKGLEKHSVSRSARVSRADEEGGAREDTSTTEGKKKPSRLTPPLEFPLNFKKYGPWQEMSQQTTDWETDEITTECYAKPQPIEYWKEMAEKDNFAMQGGVFGPCGLGFQMFTMSWINGQWFVRNGHNRNDWIMGPTADPTRYTKLALTIRDGYVHFFVDDKEVFDGKGAPYHPDKSVKTKFYNCFCFHRGSDSFYDTSKHKYHGEGKDYHAYSKAIYPLRYVVEKCADGSRSARVSRAGEDGRAREDTSTTEEKLPAGFELFDGDSVGKVAMKTTASGDDDTATIQKMIDVAVEKTGEVVLRKGTYKVSQLQLKTGVTLHLEEGAVLEKVGQESRSTAEGSVLVAAKGITDFTLMGKGTIAGDILVENCERVMVRRLGGGKLILKNSKNIVIEDSASLKLDNQNSTRILIDGKLK